jgi:hypothetical protein
MWQVIQTTTDLVFLQSNINFNTSIEFTLISLEPKYFQYSILYKSNGNINTGPNLLNLDQNDNTKLCQSRQTNTIPYTLELEATLELSGKKYKVSLYLDTDINGNIRISKGIMNIGLSSKATIEIIYYYVRSATLSKWIITGLNIEIK